METSRNAKSVPKDKLSIVYERAKQLKAEMIRSMQNTEEDSLFEPESVIVPERSELFMTKEDGTRRWMKLFPHNLCRFADGFQ